MHQLLIEEITKSLNNPLPGQDIQYQMASDDRRANIPDYKTLVDYRESAVCLMLYVKDNELHFPLIERVKYPGVHSGQIALPGGKFESTDLSMEAAALRELQEETGIELSYLTLLGKLTEVYIPPSNFMVYPFIAFSSQEPVFIMNKYEVEQIIEFKMGDLLDDSLLGKTTISTNNGNKIEAPYFNIHGHILWGATAMMLNEFKHLIKRNEIISSFLSR